MGSARVSRAAFGVTPNTSCQTLTLDGSLWSRKPASETPTGAAETAALPFSNQIVPVKLVA
jgi:hypothetical protein